MSIERIVSRAWYGDQAWIKLLSPLSKVYKRELEKRKTQAINTRRTGFPAPVVVVGNITVGGTGKTPLIIYLASALRDRGMQVGVISRGYGGNPPNTPYLVNIGDSPELCGDEPLMIAEATGVPVVIDKDRCAAAEHLVRLGVNMILSDDGLQHYALPRTYEIAVIDGERGLGNGLLLPAGPLREPLDRLDSVDFIVCNGLDAKLDTRISPNARFSMTHSSWVSVSTGTRVPLDFVATVEDVHAVAGIGNPDRFFNALRAQGIEFQQHAFPDHHRYQQEDFEFLKSMQSSTVLMTMKDALKCRDFAGPNFWALDVDLQFNLTGLGEDSGLQLVEQLMAL